MVLHGRGSLFHLFTHLIHEHQNKNGSLGLNTQLTIIILQNTFAWFYMEPLMGSKEGQKSEGFSPKVSRY